MVEFVLCLGAEGALMETDLMNNCKFLLGLDCSQLDLFDLDNKTEVKCNFIITLL